MHEAGSSSRGDRIAGDALDTIARVSGNRAGVVEWANPAFEELTGIPLAETLDKPVTRFLDRAGLSAEVVDFVAQHFYEGRTCRIELPFLRPDGRRIDVLLEVEALHDETGEVDRFTARARELPSAQESARDDSRAVAPAVDPADGRVRGDRLRVPNGADRSDLTQALRGALRGSPPRRSQGPRDVGFEVDVVLGDALPPLAAPGDEVEALVSALVEAARLALAGTEDAGATLSITTARVPELRRAASFVHPIPAPLPDHAKPGDAILEVHDTGRPLAESPPDSRRRRALARAEACARRIGASLRLDSTPGCGNQALVVFRTAD